MNQYTTEVTVTIRTMVMTEADNEYEAEDQAREQALSDAKRVFGRADSISVATEGTVHHGQTH